MIGLAPQSEFDGHHWHCPAFDRDIDHGLCWECCFAGTIGPLDTTVELKKWIRSSGRYDSLEHFHRVCANCMHCQWSGDAVGNSANRSELARECAKLDPDEERRFAEEGMAGGDALHGSD